MLALAYRTPNPASGWNGSGHIEATDTFAGARRF